MNQEKENMEKHIKDYITGLINKQAVKIKYDFNTGYLAQYDDIDALIKHEIHHKIVDYLIKNNLIEIKKTDDRIVNATTYSADFIVLSKTQFSELIKLSLELKV